MTDELFMFVGEIENKPVSLFYDQETDQGMLSVEPFDDHLGDARSLSETFRYYVGYQPSVEFLLKAELPFNHPLWGQSPNAPLN